MFSANHPSKSNLHFNRFAHLPPEIQHQIWRYAAKSKYTLQAKQELFVFMSGQDEAGRSTPTMKRFFRCISRSFMQLWVPPHTEAFDWYARDISNERRAMMRTCKTARRVALEMWRRDVEATAIGEDPYADPNVDEEELRGLKAQALVLLEDLLKH